MGESIISLRAGKSSLSDLIIGGHIGEIVATEDIDINSFVGAELSTNGFPKSYYSLSSVYNLPSSYTTKGNSYQLSPNKSILFGEDSSYHVWRKAPAFSHGDMSHTLFPHKARQ